MNFIWVKFLTPQLIIDKCSQHFFPPKDNISREKNPWIFLSSSTRDLLFHHFSTEEGSLKIAVECVLGQICV